MAEHGFGSGSSREDAVRALLGAEVEAVIAEGYAFICESEAYLLLTSVALRSAANRPLRREESVEHGAV